MAKRRSGGTSAGRGKRKTTARKQSFKPSYRRTTSGTKRTATKGNRLTSRKTTRARRRTKSGAGPVKVSTVRRNSASFAGKNGATITRKVKTRTIVQGGKKKTVKFVQRTVRNAAGKVVGQSSSRKARAGRAGGGMTQKQTRAGKTPKTARAQRQRAGGRTPKPRAARKPRAQRSGGGRTSRGGGANAPRRRRRK